VKKNRVSTLLLGLLVTSTAEETGAAGGDETDLLTGGGVAGDGRGVTDVLLVTTTVGVLDGVHGNTANLGPAVALHAVLVVGTGSLKDGLLDTATTGNEADGATSGRLEDLLGAGGETDTGGAVVLVVADDGAVVTRRAGKLSAVADLLLDVGDDGTFGQAADGEDVADLELGLGAGVDELAGVEALGGDEGLLHKLELVGVAEHHGGEGSATSGVVHDALDDTLDVALALDVVDGTVLGSTLAVSGHGVENRVVTLTLSCSGDNKQGGSSKWGSREGLGFVLGAHRAEGQTWRKVAVGEKARGMQG